MGIGINLDRAKNIAHNIRRAMRAEEFAPLDIAATIPSQAASAETSREEIRSKYAVIQTEIDNSRNLEMLRRIVRDLRTGT